MLLTCGVPLVAAVTMSTASLPAGTLAADDG
jgi:hypothetical protein